MIRQLHLRNFKCFSDETFGLRRLNLLVGLNGTGKSSVIQGLLALRNFDLPSRFSELERLVSSGSSQLTRPTPSGRFTRPQRPTPSRRLRSLSTSATWHGTLIDIGAFDDVLYVGAEEDRIQLAIQGESGDVTCDVFPDSKLVAYRSSHAPDQNAVWLESLFRDSVYYLSADRLGPRKTMPYRLEGNEVGTPLGGRGQHVLWFLGQHERYRVPPALRRPGMPRTTLLDQANAWLALVSPGIELTVKALTEADIAVASYSFEQRGDVRTKRFRPTNVGFGVSYVLPIVVALLAAKNDDLVILENPEAHLHPAGQTGIAELASMAAADGRQVILETHSDHVLDGVRLAVAEDIVNAEDVAIYFFARDDASVHVKSPELRPDGSLDSWPDGFFDQQERNLARLVAIRRGRGGGN